MTQASDTPLPLVSVAIPAYNACATLRATVDSVLAQTYPHIEVIVVDDGSTDATPSAMASYGSHIRYLRKANGGLASARNKGCEAASGEYIALLDADDVCAPERIGAQVALMQLRRDMLLCSSEFSAFNAAGPIAQQYAAKYYSTLGKTPGGVAALYPERIGLEIGPWLEDEPNAPFPVQAYAGDVYHALTRGNFIHPSTVMFRREVIASCGLFNENIPNMCDWEWLLRVARKGKIGYIERSLLNYRISTSQLSRQRISAALDILRVREELVRADPSLMQGGGARRGIGSAALDAADALVDSQRIRALSLLLKSASHGAMGLTWLKVAVKALLPATAMSLWRARRPAAHPD